MDTVLRVGRDGQCQLPDELRRRWGMLPGDDLLVQETAEGLLLRPAQPALAKVYVEPTNRCNLSCRTCVRHSWSEPLGFMDMDLYRRLVEGLRVVPSLRAVNFWGLGEPLLHPQIVEMVALANRLGARTQLITNGLLLSEKIAEGLIAAGLDSLVVSVDGVSPEAHADVRSGADLRLVHRNVRRLCELSEAGSRGNPEIGIEFVAMRSNVDQLPYLPRLALSMGASFIVVTNVLPYTEELNGEVLYGFSAGRSYPPASRSPWSPEVLLPRMDLRRETLEPLMGLWGRARATDPPPGRLGDARGYCRFVGEGAVAVAWNGDVSPCIALMHSYHCYVMGRKKLILRHVVGNVGEEGIAEIWNRDEYARFRAVVREFGFSPCSDCGGCELADSNERDCFGNGFPTCGDCLWAKGVIQCP